MKEKPAFAQRSTEASDIIQRAIEGGWSVIEIAKFSRVSPRQVYRWLREGAAPHPIMMDGLRQLDSKVASSAAE